MIEVDVANKKRFIKWFLEKYQLKRRESVWILNYLMSNSSLLEKVHFVEDAQYTPRGITMTTFCATREDGGFYFYKEGKTLADAERAFHDIRLNREKELYLELKCGGMDREKYILVLEDNPYLPEEKSGKKENRQIIDNLLDYSLYKFKKEKLLKEIEKSLIERDESEFMDLTNKLLKQEVVEKKFKTYKRN